MVENKKKKEQRWKSSIYIILMQMNVTMGDLVSGYEVSVFNVTQEHMKEYF